MKVFLKIIKFFTVLIASYLLFAFISCILPESKIDKNIKRSADDISSMGIYPNAIVQKTDYRMDNATDALIINQAFCLNNDSIMPSIMNMYRCNVPNAEITDIMKDVFTGQSYNYICYPRYWHGNTFLIRFLFLMTNYNGIRFLMFVITCFLFTVLGCMLYRKVGLCYTIGFLSGFVLLKCFVMMFSIQFFPVIMLSILSAILICFYSDNNKKVLITFFIFGSLTAYFDLLTTPMLTLVIPLMTLFVMERNKQENEKFYVGFGKIVFFSFLWGIGYSVTWFSKLVLATWITHKNIIMDAFSQFIFRTKTDANFSRLDAIHSNMLFIPWTYIIIGLIMLIILAVLFFNRKGLKNMFLFIIIMIMPYVWYFMAANHSYIHSWFTYRAQIGSISCAFFAIMSIIDWNKMADKFRHNVFITFHR